MMMAFAAVFALTACGEDTPGGDNTGGNGGGNNGAKLATPELSETHTETSITVSWGAIENAEVYVVNFDGKNYTTEQLTYTFENVNAGNYTIRVVARADGYKDSDPAKINVTITGATEVDWFTQTVSLPAAEGETVEYPDGQVVTYMPYNSVKVLWKGTEVDDIKYGLFETEALASATDVQIKGNLTAPSKIVEWLELINAEEGLEIVYGGCTGSTSYTACVWVKNKAGQEFFTKNEITTAEAVVTDATKSWLGTYTAYTEQVVDIAAEEGSNPVKNERTDFTFTVTVVPGTADEVMIDGMSIMGEQAPAYGQVFEQDGANYLAIINGIKIADVGDGYYATWMPYCALDDGSATFVMGEFGAIYLSKDAEGNVVYEAGAGTLNSGKDFSVAAFDILALNPETRGMAILSDNAGNAYSVWKYGEWKNIQKSASATARALNAPAKQLRVAYELPASMLY